MIINQVMHKKYNKWCIVITFSSIIYIYFFISLKIFLTKHYYVQGIFYVRNSFIIFELKNVKNSILFTFFYMYIRNSMARECKALNQQTVKLNRQRIYDCIIFSRLQFSPHLWKFLMNRTGLDRFAGPLQLT